MAEPTGIVRFGAFEVAVDAGQLRKNGLKLKLREQAFQVLVALLERPGEIVTRDELRQKLWPDDTFVDFDQGLNTAITRIREALGDSAANPRFVETLPRRGYRFIAPVESPPIDQPPATKTDHSESGDSKCSRRWPLFPYPLVVLVLGVAIGLVVGFWLRGPRQSTEIPFRKFTITPREYVWHAEISPNGRYIAYTAGNPQHLWILDLQQDQPRRVEGTVGARRPFWSPDSEHIGFAAGGELRRVGVTGGDVAALCRYPANDTFVRGTWSPDGSSVVFACYEPFSTNRLYEVAARGGSPKILTSSKMVGPPTNDAAAGIAKFVPSLSRTLVGGSKGRIVSWNLDTSEIRILADGYWPVFAPSGYLLYQSSAGNKGSGELLARPISAKTLEPIGEPFPVADSASLPSVSADGTLVYVDPGIRNRQLVWLNRNGEKLSTVGQAQKSIRGPALSPDSRSVAVYGTEAGTWRIWVHDIERTVRRQLTLPSGGFRPIWSSDGKQIAFSRKGKLYLRSAAASGESQEHTEGLPCDFSRDGLYLVYQRGKDIWYRKSGGEPAAFAETRFPDRVAKLSPDGRFIAYCSLRSGRDEIVVQPFPGGEEEWPISPTGGTQPRWSGDGRELFYVSDDTLFAVSVTLTPKFSWETPRALFSHPGLVDEMPEQQYDVTDDGQRFILTDILEPEPDERPSIHIVQNWSAEFQDFERDE